MRMTAQINSDRALGWRNLRTWSKTRVRSRLTRVEMMTIVLSKIVTSTLSQVKKTKTKQATRS